MKGTDFDQRVYAMVGQIPHGHLSTYGQVADRIGAYGCARQVGWALRRLSLPSQIPWQRVVNAQGRISMSLKHMLHSKNIVNLPIQSAQASPKSPESTRIHPNPPLKKGRIHPANPSVHGFHVGWLCPCPPVFPPFVV